jgi:hypothetical protein
VLDQGLPLPDCHEALESNNYNLGFFSALKDNQMQYSAHRRLFNEKKAASRISLLVSISF